MQKCPEVVTNLKDGPNAQKRDPPRGRNKARRRKAGNGVRISVLIMLRGLWGFILNEQRAQKHPGHGEHEEGEQQDACGGRCPSPREGDFTSVSSVAPAPAELVTMPNRSFLFFSFSSSSLWHKEGRKFILLARPRGTRVYGTPPPAPRAGRRCPG